MCYKICVCSQEADISDIPPPPQWEIPRTPIVPLIPSSSSSSSTSPPPLPPQEKQGSHTQTGPHLPPSPPLPSHRPVQHSPVQPLPVHSIPSPPQREKTPHTNGDSSHVSRVIESLPSPTAIAGTVGEDSDRSPLCPTQPESTGYARPAHSSAANRVQSSSDSPPGEREEEEDDGSSRDTPKVAASQEENELPLPVSSSPPILALKGIQTHSNMGTCSRFHWGGEEGICPPSHNPAPLGNFIMTCMYMCRYKVHCRIHSGILTAHTE